MEVLFTEQFEQAYERLTTAEKRSVRKALTLLGANSKHPSLRVRKMQGGRDIWEARVSMRLRVTFEMDGETIFMRNVS